MKLKVFTDGMFANKQKGDLYSGGYVIPFTSSKYLNKNKAVIRRVRFKDVPIHNGNDAEVYTILACLEYLVGEIKRLNINQDEEVSIDLHTDSFHAIYMFYDMKKFEGPTYETVRKFLENMPNNVSLSLNHVSNVDRKNPYIMLVDLVSRGMVGVRYEVVEWSCKNIL